MTPDQIEAHRHRCEVRDCIRRGPEWFKRWFNGPPSVADRRGRVAAQKLWADVKAQAAAGNSGAPGEWIDN